MIHIHDYSCTYKHHYGMHHFFSCGVAALFFPSFFFERSICISTFPILSQPQNTVKPTGRRIWERPRYLTMLACGV